MKKVGIITHYYGSVNYGGVLQAYALCKKLNLMGYNAEQIQYIHAEENSENADKLSISRLKNSLRYRVDRVVNNKFYSDISMRYKAFEKFRSEIPHSNMVYSIDTVGNCNELYDAFVTGSDQVWNIDWFDDAYFLGFVKNKPKFSYSASLGTDEIPEERKNIFREKLADYAAISVREQDSVNLLQPLVDKKVICTLDPTLLLSADEWDEAVPKRKIKDRYLFCYFLGTSATERKLANEYAKQHKLKTVTLPYLNGLKNKCDDNFGDERLFDVPPPDFISLIKYAECIFTDSFHASVFSCIYNKPFFVFPREKFGKMSNRIVSLTGMFGNENRFCHNEERQNIEYINSVEFNGYNSDFLSDKKEKSVEFLYRIGGKQI